MTTSRRPLAATVRRSSGPFTGHLTRVAWIARVTDGP